MSLLKVNTVQTDTLQSVAGVNRNSVLQVVSKEVTTQTQTSSTSFVDATDVFLAITPTSATSKILVTFNVPMFPYRSNTASLAAARLLRGTDVVFNPSLTNTTGTYFVGLGISGATTTNWRGYQTFQFLDNPATTNEITYKMQVCVYTASDGGTVVVNETGTSSGNAISVITLMEIAQ